MGYVYFTNKIRRLRKDAGYTQEDVSRKLNIQRQTYCNYENGTRMPPIEIIVALSELYQTSVDSLLHEAPQTDKSGQNTCETKFINEFSSLSENKQREVVDFIHFKKQLPY